MSSQPNLEDQSDPPHPRSKIARYDRYYDVRTFSYVYRKSNRPIESKFSKKITKRKKVLLVVRDIDSRGQPGGTRLEIKSKPLCELLINLNPSVEDLSLSTASPECNPRLLLTSHLKLVEALAAEKAKENPDVSLISDIDVALTFIEDDYSEFLAVLTDLINRHTISFDLLEFIFTPGELVYRFEPVIEQPQLLMCRTFEVERRRDGSVSAKISGEIIRNDGRSFGVVRESFRVCEMFRGVRPIHELAVYPVKYCKDPEGLRSYTLQRGKEFVQMDSASPFNYREISGPSYDENGKKLDSYGRVMVDPSAFRKFEPNSVLNKDVDKVIDKNEMTDEQFMICTPIMLGFCFGTKTWGGFALDRMSEVQFSDEAFNCLVLGETQKRLIYSLVKQHATRTNTFDDIVIGKGKGLIGLLAGRPGCGKTLTAEAVAEVTHRPLYAISAGELGTNTEQVDDRLRRLLQLAQTWDAVLLLDEAEVFLHQRDNTNIVRNALVSIFLRQLEYYQGILILTTNMISHCDLAFESRIHFSVYYPDLSFEARRKVWEIFLGKAVLAQEPLNEVLDSLGEVVLNGRQIKNTVSTARTLAADRDEQLSLEHIQTVLEVARDWNKARELEDYKTTKPVPTE